MTVRSVAPIFLLLALGFTEAFAAWTVKYDGPDQVMLVSRPNGAGTSTRGLKLDIRDLPEGSLEQLLTPMVTAALEGCSMDGVARVVVTPATSVDRISSAAMTRYRGLGIYANLSSADRVQIGNWFLAPFFFLGFSLEDDKGKALDSVELFEFRRDILDTDPIGQEAFLKAPTEDVEASVVAYARRQLPQALRAALGSRCKH